MSENLRQFTKAVYGMDHVVRLADDDAWGRPSPCTDWDARGVLDHAAGVLRMVEGMARDGAVTAAPDGAGPAASWAAARDATLEALDHQHVLQKVAATPFGEMPLDAFLGVIFIDTLVHTWDLARALGVDDRLDAGLVARADAAIRPLGDGIRGPGMFGPAVEPPADADAQARLLCYLGRQA